MMKCKVLLLLIGICISVSIIAQPMLQQLNSNLFQAVNDAHVVQVRKLLQQGANPNARDAFAGNTPLHIAIQSASYGQPNPKKFSDYIDIITLLLAYGANPTMQNNQAQDAFAYARFSSHRARFRTLLNNPPARIATPAD